jgi:hypothetical protein
MRLLRGILAGSGASAWGRTAPLFHALVCGAVLAFAMRAGAEAKLTFVDLQPKANHKLAEDLHESEGNNLANVPQGEQQMGEARFRIGEKMVHLRGEHAAEMPQSVEIPVNASGDRIHILHSTGYGEGDPEMADGTEIGAYVIHYADQSTERIPVRYGEELRDWWENPARNDLKNASVAWSGTNPAADQIMRKIRLYAIRWTNPHPEKEIATIEAQSQGTLCDPFVVAVTVEKK